MTTFHGPGDAPDEPGLRHVPIIALALLLAPLWRAGELIRVRRHRAPLKEYHHA